MADTDSRPLVRVLGLVSGVLGGVGAYCYQWVLRHPGGGVLGALAIFIAIVCCYIAFGLAAVVATAAITVTVRAERRVWLLPLYIVASLFALLYALGGRWPFWRP